MAELIVRRNALQGRQARHWETDGVVIVLLGDELDELDERRIIRDAMRVHGIRHRRFLLPVPVGERVRRTAREHPTATTAVTAALAVSVAASAYLGGQPSEDRPPRRSDPPVVAGPAPTHGPATTSPQPDTMPPVKGGAVPAPRPSPENGTVHVLRPPTRDRTAPTDEHAPSPLPTKPPTTATEPPTAEPPTRPPGQDQDQCLLNVGVLDLAKVRALCI